jgi:hypothetical protein
MIATRSPIAVVLAFANDWVDDRRHLRGLLDEGKAIHGALAPLTESGALAVLPAIQNATLDDVIGAFRDRAHRDRIRIFHFGGHASGSVLLFEDAAGQPSEAHAAGLAGYLGRQRGLVLVFLNGCSTEPQVRHLRAAGVKAVVATTQAIQDDVATAFATAFYAELTTRSLRDAFDAAVHAVRAKWGDAPQSLVRDLAGPSTGAAHRAAPPVWPWVFDCDPAYERWSLAGELTHRLWRTRLALAVAAATAFLIASFAISAGARHTMCGAPGVRGLCASLGIGDVATAAEQALWDQALAQRAGDGLRGYLRSYPSGAYANEAKARLDGCRHDWIETLESEIEVRYPLVLNPVLAQLSATEAEAQADALQRGAAEAASACEPLRHVAEIIATRAEPHRWDCAADGTQAGCGFTGNSVCRIRRRVASDREDCSSP